MTTFFCLAHAGHGATGGGSLLHYLIEPAHLPFTILGTVAALGLAGWAVARLAKRSSHR